MNHNDILLSKEDYLALSEEYQKEKAQIKKQCGKQQIIGGIVMGIGIFVIPFLLIPIFLNSGMSMWGVIVIGMIVMGVGIAILALAAQKGEKLPEEVGVKYYQRYVAEYNATHHNNM